MGTALAHESVIPHPHPHPHTEFLGGDAVLWAVTAFFLLSLYRLARGPRAA